MAASRSSTISRARTSGSGRLSDSSRLSSRSQKMSRLSLSRVIKPALPPAISFTALATPPTTGLPVEKPWIKNGGVAEDIYQNLLRILRYESKDTTYKFALLRGLIEISSESPHIKQARDFVTAPFGLL